MEVAGVLRIVLDVDDGDPEILRRLSSVLTRAIVGDRHKRPVYAAWGLDPEQLKRLVKALVSRPEDASEGRVTAVLELARPLGEGDDAAVTAWATAKAWGLLGRVSDTAEKVLVRALLGHAGNRRSQERRVALVPPVTLFADPAWAGRFFRRTVPYRDGSDNGLARGGLGDDPRFWSAAIAFAATVEEAREARDLASLLDDHLADDLPPPDLDADWIALVSREPWRDRPPSFMLRAAARSGRPEFLVLVRNLTIERD